MPNTSTFFPRAVPSKTSVDHSVARIRLGLELEDDVSSSISQFECHQCSMIMIRSSIVGCFIWTVSPLVSHLATNETSIPTATIATMVDREWEAVASIPSLLDGWAYYAGTDHRCQRIDVSPYPSLASRSVASLVRLSSRCQDDR